MKQETYTTTMLYAEDGHMLTQAADVPITERAVAPCIALGRHDSPDNYREITTAEAAAYEAARTAELDRLAAARLAALEATSHPDIPES